jgi:hypothetical protein
MKNNRKIDDLYMMHREFIWYKDIAYLTHLFLLSFSSILLKENETEVFQGLIKFSY